MTIGELSVFVSIGGFLPYLWTILKGQTKPERASWFVWTIILGLSLMGYHAAGATDSLWFLVGEFATTALVFIISLFKGRGGFGWLDITSIILALFGIALWQLTNQPLTVFIGTVLADIMGVVPTIKKALDDPEAESASVFISSSIAAGMGFVAVGAWNWGLLVYPFYLFLINGLTAQTVLVGKYHVAHGWSGMFNIRGSKEEAAK